MQKASDSTSTYIQSVPTLLYAENWSCPSRMHSTSLAGQELKAMETCFIHP